MDDLLTALREGDRIARREVMRNALESPREKSARDDVERATQPRQSVANVTFDDENHEISSLKARLSVKAPNNANRHQQNSHQQGLHCRMPSWNAHAESY